MDEKTVATVRRKDPRRARRRERKILALDGLTTRRAYAQVNAFLVYATKELNDASEEFDRFYVEMEHRVSKMEARLELLESMLDSARSETDVGTVAEDATLGIERVRLDG